MGDVAVTMRPRRKQKFEGNVPGLADLRTAARREYAVLDRVPPEWARLVTVIIGAVKVKSTDDVADIVAGEMAKFKSEFRDCAMLHGFLKRGTRWAGVIEIDLAHPSFLKAQKRKLLRCFGVDDIAPDERVIIVHLHAVIDFRGHASPDVLLRDLRKTFPGHNRIDARRMHTDKTMTQNLERIADYCTKHMRAYSVWGEEEDGRTRFYNENEPEWRTWMDRLYASISLENTLFSSVSSRAESLPECPRLPVKTLTPQGFSEASITEELIQIKPSNSLSPAALKYIAGDSHNTIHEPMPIIHLQRSQTIVEQCATPFDEAKPMIFYMMKRIMQKTVGPPHPGMALIQNAA
jgi:hypothetical protein